MTEVPVTINSEDVLVSARMLAPAAELPAIAASALRSHRAQDFSYDEGRHQMTASIDDARNQGRRAQPDLYTIAITWVPEESPLVDLAQYGDSYALHANSIMVSVRVTREQGFRGYAQTCREKAKSVFQKMVDEGHQAIQHLHRYGPATDRGSARFVSLVELRNQDYVDDGKLQPPESSLCFRIGDFTGKSILVPKPFTEAHVLVVGQPGSGKSRGVFLPNLNERLHTSAIVTEVVARETDQPPLFKLSAGFRERGNHRIYYFNPLNYSSTRFNIIDFIESVRDALNYAYLIITNTSAKYHIGDQIWVQSETQLLTALLLYARGLRGPGRSVKGGLSNLGYIRNLLRHGPETVNQFVQDNGIPPAKRMLAEFMNNSSDKFRLGVFSGLISRLNTWLDPGVCALTEVTDFDVETLRTELFTFYLSYPISRSEQFRPIMALLVNLLLSFAQKGQFKHPLTLLLDEFGAFGQIPYIDDVQATIRNAEIGLVLGFQNLWQLPRVYSKEQARTIYENCATKVVFANDSPELQKRVMDVLGRTTQVKINVTKGGDIQRRTEGRPLLDASEIGGIVKGKALIIRSGYSPSAFIAQVCDFGKYNHYENTYPLKPRAEHQVDDVIEDLCSESKNKMPDEEIADRYARRYQDNWLAISDARDLLKNAKSDRQKKQLQRKLDIATEEHRKFMELSRQQRQNVIDTAKRDAKIRKPKKQNPSEVEMPTPTSKQNASQSKQPPKTPRKSAWEHEQDDSGDTDVSWGWDKLD